MKFYKELHLVSIHFNKLEATVAILLPFNFKVVRISIFHPAWHWEIESFGIGPVIS
jgi:hypothetical protein